LPYIRIDTRSYHSCIEGGRAMPLSSSTIYFLSYSSVYILFHLQSILLITWVGLQIGIKLQLSAGDGQYVLMVEQPQLFLCSASSHQVVIHKVLAQQLPLSFVQYGG